jgi:hypothetical protein
MTCEMEILNGDGHLTLSWDPDDQVSVARAQAEFERLLAAGYAFFAEPASAVRVKRLTPAGWTKVRALDVRPEQIREFTPRARRTVAVRPMVGG